MVGGCIRFGLVMGAGVAGMISATTLADTLSFRQGQDSGFGVYSGASDTWIDATAGAEDTNFGSDASLRVDLSPNRQSLIRLDNLFGPAAGQIPLGSTIVSAQLTINVENAGISRDPTRMLQSWDATTLTWNNAKLGGNTQAGIQDDNVEAVTVTNAFNANTLGAWNLDVTAIVQAWSSGAPNYGFFFRQSNTDALMFTSSDGATVANRPLLTVEFVPEPCGALGIVASALALHRRRR